MMRDHCYKIEGNEIISLGNRSQFSQISEILSANDWVLRIVIYKKLFWCLVSNSFDWERRKRYKIFSQKIFGKYFYVIYRK